MNGQAASGASPQGTKQTARGTKRPASPGSEEDPPTEWDVCAYTSYSSSCRSLLSSIAGELGGNVNFAYYRLVAYRILRPHPDFKPDDKDQVLGILQSVLELYAQTGEVGGKSMHTVAAVSVWGALSWRWEECVLVWL